MKLLYLIIILLLLLFVTIIILVIVGYIGHQIYNVTKTKTEEIINKTPDADVNLTNYDLVSKLTPLFLLLDVALIIAFIFMVVAVFMHSRKR